ncbi:MAG: hypothetical protein R3B45_06965 [Bdellovibrionota bacterium]
MRERLAQLKKLTTEALILNCKKVRDNERKSEVALIAFLSELRNRCGFLDYGYNSIFTFCQQELGLEDGPSYLRMQVAKVCQKFPQILEELESGRLSLSSAAKLSPVLTYDNVDELLTSCAGKKVREVALIVGRLKPETPVSSRIYPMGSKKKEKSVPLDLCKNNSIAPSLAPSMMGEKSKVGDKADSLENVQVKVNLEEQFFNFRFVAGKQLREKLLRLAEVMNVANMELNLAEILEESVDLALQQKDPQLKEERRQARLQKKKFAEKEQRKDEGKKAKTKEEQNKKTKAAPEKGVRDKEEIEQEQQKEREKKNFVISQKSEHRF